MRTVENVILVAFVAAVIFTDWRWRRIPNAFTYPVMAAGLVLGTLEAVPGELFVRGLFDHVAGLAVGLLVAYPFYAAGGLKAGDGKYLMAVGALRGLGLLLYGAVYGALSGGRGRDHGRAYEDVDPVRRGARPRNAPRARTRDLRTAAGGGGVIVEITTPVWRADDLPVYCLMGRDERTTRVNKGALGE